MIKGFYVMSLLQVGTGYAHCAPLIHSLWAETPLCNPYQYLNQLVCGHILLMVVTLICGSSVAETAANCDCNASTLACEELEVNVQPHQ